MTTYYVFYKANDTGRVWLIDYYKGPEHAPDWYYCLKKYKEDPCNIMFLLKNGTIELVEKG